MEYIHLVGAEQVQNAARQMQTAAEEMQQAARNIDGTFERHQRFMDDWLQRLEALFDQQGRAATGTAGTTT